MCLHEYILRIDDTNNFSMSGEHTSGHSATAITPRGSANKVPACWTIFFSCPFCFKENTTELSISQKHPKKLSVAAKECLLKLITKIMITYCKRGWNIKQSDRLHSRRNKQCVGFHYIHNQVLEIIVMCPAIGNGVHENERRDVGNSHSGRKEKIAGKSHEAKGYRSSRLLLLFLLASDCRRFSSAACAVGGIGLIEEKNLIERW